MDAVKPASAHVGGLARAFAQILRLRAVGVGPDDALKKIKMAPAPPSSATVPGGDADEEERLCRIAASKVVLARLFASIAAIKAAYAQLQIAQSPYDPDLIQASDQVVVSELKCVSELKQCHLKRQVIPSLDSQLAAELREQQSLFRTYELMVKKLQSQLQLKVSEITFLREKLADSDNQTRALERQLSPSLGPFAALDSLHLPALNATHFLAVHHHVVKSVRSFARLMLDEMTAARWDLDAAADSIHPGFAYSSPDHRLLAFESYVCRKLFAGFQDPDFSIPLALAAQQRRKRRQHFSAFVDLKSSWAAEALSEASASPFAEFCRIKYLSTVHPEMEAAFFGNLRLRELVASGACPDAPPPFFGAFAEMARRAWLLHCLAFSFEPHASIFAVASGSLFSDVYMEAAVPLVGCSPDARPRVVFTVVPGFTVGKTVVQSRVYVAPAS